MGKTIKIIVCGKKAIGKTTLLEQLIFNNFSTQKINEKYFPTIEDTYIACWEKDKGIKEKIRFYDTRGIISILVTFTFNWFYASFSYCFIRHG
jgi:NF-kappa-B inhibitor-interacting Ras-like protein